MPTFTNNGLLGSRGRSWCLVGQEVGRGPDLLLRECAGYGVHGLAGVLALPLLEVGELVYQVVFALSLIHI